MSLEVTGVVGACGAVASTVGVIGVVVKGSVLISEKLVTSKLPLKCSLLMFTPIQRIYPFALMASLIAKSGLLSLHSIAGF